MRSEFLTDFAAALGKRGVHVVRFEFPYMTKRKRGSKSPPDRAEVLLASYRAVASEVGQPARTYIGGKSMGGRIASMVADELGVRGVVCLGYPFHPPGAPDKLRTAHLATLATPCLIVQGSRDPFGSEQEIAGYNLSRAIQLVVLPDGDHSFVPRKASGHTRKSHFDAALEATDRFLREHA
jgi:predicted alpha/beta-hydrolase family hydrolase